MNYRLISLVLIVNSCQSGEIKSQNEALSPERRVSSDRLITKAILKSVSFDISTFMAVDCDKFDFQFADAAVIKIENDSVLTELSNRISALKRDTAKFELDTRAKVTLYYTNRATSTLCIGESAMEFDGNQVKYDERICKLLRISEE